MAHIDDTVVSILEALRLRNALKRCLPYAPRWIRQLVERRRIRKRCRLVDEEQLNAEYRDALLSLSRFDPEIGDYLEFGVYDGTSLACMYHVLQGLNIQQVRLFGFDSFEGLPPIAATDCGGHWQPGQFKSSYEFTTQVLEYEGVDFKRVVLTKGFFDSTLTAETHKKLGLRKAAVIMVDCDLYQSAKEALAFCEPLIVDRSIIFFDDWFALAEQGMGEQRAFDEFLASAPCFKAEEFCEFKPYGKTFLVSRTSARRNDQGST